MDFILKAIFGVTAPEEETARSVISLKTTMDCVLKMMNFVNI